MNRPFNVPLDLRSGPEFWWAAMCAMPNGFTITDIANECARGARVTVGNYIRYCAKHGFIKLVGERPAPQKKVAKVYVVARKLKDAPVRHDPEFLDTRGRCQQQLWTAIRTLPQFGIPELAMAASIDTSVVGISTTREYVRRLLNAGVLAAVKPYVRARKGTEGATAGVYRLKPSCNFGPLAPKVFKASIVFDPNARKIIGESEASA